MKSLIIIPTYNEKENVKKMVHAIMELKGDFHLLIVDDNSPDGTAAIVKALQRQFPERLHLEERSGKLGLGTAYIHGFKWGLAREYSYLFEMDCDFSHRPEDVPRLLSACEEGADLAIGSRYVKGGNVSNWDRFRLLLSYFASWYVRMVLKIDLCDTTAGFKCYRRSVLSTIHLDNIHFKGYAFQICMKYATIVHGFKAVEIPITFVDRELGQSKMSLSIFKEALTGVWKMRKLTL